jgi:hypothetical protein
VNDFGFRITLADISSATGCLEAEFPEAPSYKLLMFFGESNFILAQMLSRQGHILATWLTPQSLLPTVLQSANSFANGYSAAKLISI